MTEGEKRINIILINYAKGKYSLAYLKDLATRGQQTVEERGVMGVDKRFITNLACLETAIKRIERSHNRKGN